ncbi:MAG: cation:proton antiporter regulatory subunit [Homoserinimonas sp.]
MGVRIEKTELPGIGVRHDLVTGAGRRIGVVSHRDGERDLALYDIDDPDACRDSIVMSDDEATALADLLGGSLILSQLSGLTSGTAGVFTEQLQLPATSPYLNRPLGDTKARSRTGVSIVAIVRGTEIIPSPTPADELNPGDTIIAVGTRDGLTSLGRLLAGDSR